MSHFACLRLREPAGGAYRDPGDETKAQAVYDHVRHLLALVKPEAAVQVSQYAEGTVLPALTQAKETVKDVAEQVKEKAAVQLPEEVAPYVRDAAEGAVETAEAAEGEWHTVTHKKGKKGKKQAQAQAQEQEPETQEQEPETQETTGEGKAKGQQLPGIGAWTEQDEQDARELRTAFEQVAKEARTFLDSLRSDATVRNVEASLTALMHDLFLDDKGAPQLKVDLLADLQKVLPLVVRRLATVPVARIDYGDQDLDLILDNVELDCVLAPANVNLVTETHWAPDLGQVVSTAKLQMRGMRVDARNVVFYYNRKRFPKVADVGIADVVIGGDRATTMSHAAEAGTDEAAKAHARAQLAAGTVGMDIDLTLQPARDPQRLVHVAECTATIHDLTLDVKRSRHPWMYTLLSPVLDRYLRARLEQATADMVAGAVERLDRVVEQAMAQGKAMQEQMHPGATIAAALSSVGGSREE
ncbi:hypothetical protein AMAG_20415 [Allomyces macrogynus ATCC 38327]|uniref:HAM1-like N-terminal domain-containing protein n=1 Tax=Allomyces macrogynus (strain ATCC 38327) TaxID=578462 RepID=A0A0L0T8T0_ALLM3|nr:hypothetical protein AMAG_20415 [Allomyces macrogynus ATCC 38327]|eukprot:KNE71218.1 hypothetical protein AMAG_20415 [Allomyces macrogynus ATCC 38327]